MSFVLHPVFVPPLSQVSHPTHEPSPRIGEHEEAVGGL